MSFISAASFGERSWITREDSFINGGVLIYNKNGGPETLFFSNDEYYNEGRPSTLALKYDHIINGLLLNKKWPKNNIKVNSDEDLLKVLNQFTFPKTPKEKLDNLFEFLFNLQTKDGEVFQMETFWNNNFSVASLYFKDNEECNFYLNVLHEKGLIKGSFSNTKGSFGMMNLGNITFDGFQYFNEIANEGQKSKNCLVAMSFSEGMLNIKLAIKNAIDNTGFSPILINEIHVDAEKTINDEIVAQLKKSKFCVADFTEQRDGVYFESGYALGRGLKVIYTCHEDDFERSHFDTKHFPHIIYKNPEELQEKLINKIEAWIKD